MTSTIWSKQTPSGDFSSAKTYCMLLFTCEGHAVLSDSCHCLIKLITSYKADTGALAVWACRRASASGCVVRIFSYLLLSHPHHPCIQPCVLASSLLWDRAHLHGSWAVFCCNSTAGIPQGCMLGPPWFFVITVAAQLGSELINCSCPVFYYCHSSTAGDQIKMALRRELPWQHNCRMWGLQCPT